MIPFFDLSAQYRSIQSEIVSAISEVLGSSQFILGPQVGLFEKQFAEYCGVRHAIGVNSGTSALHLALLGLGVGPGDEVITVAHTFVATAAAITYTGATPVLIDVDPRRHTLEWKHLQPAITERTRAIIPVHIYGQMAEMDPIGQIAAESGIPLIEDAAQAHGATYGGRAAGSIGKIGCFSFYPGKNLGAYGEAGCVVTNDGSLAQKMRAIRDWGQLERGTHSLPGYNYRMEAIQGAVLGVKLRYLDKWNAARAGVARLYDELFSERGMTDNLVTPLPCPDGRHVYHQYVIRLKERDRVRGELLRRGIHTGIHYAKPVHLQPIFWNLGYPEGSFPRSEQIARECLSLPMFPELGEKEVRQVVSNLHEVLSAS